LVVTEECSDHLRDQIRALGHHVTLLQRDSVVGEFRIARLRSAGLPALTAHVDAVAPQRRAFPLPVSLASSSTCSSKAMPLAPQRPPGFCAGCSHVGPFDVLSRLDRYVVGDIGCYTLGSTPAFGALHSNLCMGASIGVLQGYLMMEPARRREVIGVIGDSTFFHSGIPSLLTAVNNQQSGTLMVLDNSGTAMTGFQHTGPNLDAAGWDTLLAALGVKHRAVVPSLNVEAIEAQIKAFDDTEGIAVIVLKGLCVQGREKKGPTNFRYSVSTDACTGCGQCQERTDCPALEPTTNAKGEAVFEITNACIGCGMCSQTCPEHAILPMTVKTGVATLDRALAHVPWERVIRFVQSKPALHRIAEKFERTTD
jgi:indolepyruvate ferredoxin oxidoreductase, alpha subunit